MTDLPQDLPATWSGTMQFFGVSGQDLPHVAIGDEVDVWVERKLTRGFLHLREIEAVTLEWQSSLPLWMRYKSIDEHTILATLEVRDQPPYDEISVRLGDAIHSYRSALDALVWELCTLDGALPATDVERSIQFPITTKTRDWARQDWPRKLATMPKHFQDRIRDVQPAADPQAQGLLHLARLSNQDKHRGQVTGEAELERMMIPISVVERIGAGDGNLRFDFLNNAALIDGLDLYTMQSSFKIRPTRTRVPATVQYSVNDGVVDAPLTAVMDMLASIPAMVAYILSGINQQQTVQQ